MKKKLILAFSLMLVSRASYAYLNIDTEFLSNVKTGASDKFIVEESLFLPIKKLGDGLFFTDLRQGFDNKDSSFASVGLGLRSLFWQKSVLGFYAFYDYLQLDHGDALKQTSFGVEVLSDVFEARSNLYAPIDVKKNMTSNGDVFSSTQEIKIKDGKTFIEGEFGGELALSGIDGELGFKLPKINTFFYVGGYDFYHNDQKRAIGLKLRAKLSKSISDYMKLGLQCKFKKDDVGGKQFGIGLSLNFPLFQSVKPQMTEKIERERIISIIPFKRYQDPEVDVTTQVFSMSASQKKTLLDNIKPRFSVPEDKISEENADVDIVKVVGDAREGALIILDGTDGDIAAKSTIKMKRGQIIQSATIDKAMVRAKLDGKEFDAVLQLSGEGTQPKIVADNAEGGFVQNDPLLLLSESGTVDGVSFDGAGLPEGSIYSYQGSHGGVLEAQDVNNFIIRDNIISSEVKGINGILIQNASNGLIDGNTINTNAEAANGILTSNTDDRQGGSGHANSSSSSNIYNNNSISVQGKNSGGIGFYNYGHGQKINNNTVSGNTISTEGENSLGIYFYNDCYYSGGNSIKDNKVIGNRITAQGSKSIGLILSSCHEFSDTVIRGNTFYVSGLDVYAITLGSADWFNWLVGADVQNTKLEDNVIFVTDTGESAAASLRFAGAQNTAVRNNAFSSSSANPRIFFDEGRENTVLEQESTGNTYDGIAPLCAGNTTDGSKISFVDDSTCPASTAKTSAKPSSTKSASVAPKNAKPTDIAPMSFMPMSIEPEVITEANEVVPENSVREDVKYVKTEVAPKQAGKTKNNKAKKKKNK